MTEASTFERLFLTEPTIAKLTPEAIREALIGFPLQSRHDDVWLARAIQGALFYSLSAWQESPDRQSATKTGKELFAIAEKIEAASLALAARSREADSALWDYASERDGPGDDEPPLHFHFRGSADQLYFLSTFLRRAGMMSGVEKPHWSAALAKEERIRRACALSPVFQEAFERQPALTRGPLAKSLGHWADFYGRIVSLAFGDHAPLNLEEVLREARSRHRAARVRFAPGLVPE